MKHLLVTTMLVLPLGAGAAFAQETTAEEAGEAAGDAVETTVEGIQEGAEAAGDAIESGVEEAQTETMEADVEVVPAEEAETETIEADVEVIPAEEAETGEAAAGEPVPEQIVREQAPNELRLDWITGTNVTSPEGETIGDVNDLIIDGETGQLSAAILSVGGFLGIGAKQIAVDWSELQVDYDANELSLAMTREQADAAPEYVFREQEQPPAPVPAETGMGTGTGTLGTEGTGTTTGTTNVPAQ